MKTWLRLTLVTVTVGGGFTGLAITLPDVFSQEITSPLPAAIVALFLSVNIFVLISGLLLVQNPRWVMPTVIALLIQIPVISSPIIAYHLGTALYLAVGWKAPFNLFALIRFGSEWQFNVYQPLPWIVGINLVPVVLLLAIMRSRPNRRELPSPTTN